MEREEEKWRELPIMLIHTIEKFKCSICVRYTDGQKEFLVINRVLDVKTFDI